MKDCRSCGGQVDKFLDLGHQPPSDAFLSLEQLSEPETYYPLEVFACKDCSLVQLGYVVDPAVLFNDSYPYETGVNTGGVKHFYHLAADVFERFKPKFVLDIGSNDGTLLRQFKNMGCEVLGVEPCAHIAKKAVANGVQTIPGFWGKDLEVGGWFNNVDIITATNVFAHVSDLHGFMECVKNHLNYDGVFIIESPYLPDMIEGVQYDQIYHEHLYYWSLKALSRVVCKYDMTVFDCVPQKIHGGLMRYFIGRKGVHQYVKHNMRAAIEREKDIDFEGFENKVILHAGALRAIMERKLVLGASAPAKGNTLINYCGINLPCILEKDGSPKICRFTPGRHIEVVNEADLNVEVFDYLLILAHNWKDEIIKSLRGRGYKGKFIIPFPEPRIV